MKNTESKNLSPNYEIIDIRSQTEYIKGHIYNARNIDMNKLLNENDKYLDKSRLFLYITIMLMTIIYMIPSAVYHSDMLFAFTCILFAYALQFSKKGRLVSYEE